MPAKRSWISCVLLTALLAPLAACEPEELVEVENQPPKAVASGPTAARTGEVVAFDGSLSSDPDGRIASFAWSFGDGTTGSGDGPSHIYAAAGDYQVTLTVTDEQGASAEDALDITITANQPPQAVIEGPTTAEVGETIRLSAASSSDADGQISAYSWLLSDGALGDAVELDHAFASAGSFTATLTVTDDAGASAEDTHVVEVTAPPPDYSGTWSWSLVDPSQRDLGLICGTFQDSTLTIDCAPPSITITEQAGTESVVYTGTISGQSFSVANSVLTITQSISGTFTSATTFEAVYAIDPGITTCEDRAVLGVKVQ